MRISVTHRRENESRISRKKNGKQNAKSREERKNISSQRHGKASEGNPIDLNPHVSARPSGETRNSRGEINQRNDYYKSSLNETTFPARVRLRCQRGEREAAMHVCQREILRGDGRGNAF